MNIKTSAILVLVTGLVISGCASERVIEPTLTSTPTFTPIPTQTFIATTTMTPTPMALTKQCVQWNLTPEGCANTGSHEYSTNTQLLFEKTGRSCIIDNSNRVSSIKFLSGEAFLLTDPYRSEIEFTRKDQNVYSGVETQPDSNFEWKSTITFTADGFIEEFDTYDLEKNELICAFVWEQKIIGLVVPMPTANTDNFILYDPTKCANSEHFSDYASRFSFKYPPEWECGWLADSGAIALIISSDANADDMSGATMMILSAPYSGEKLTDFFSYKGGLKPSAITINDQEAARVEYTRNDAPSQMKVVEVVIVREKWVLSVFTYFPAEQETEFRSLIEGIIGTIEIK